MKKSKVEFITGVNNLYNNAGNSVRDIENMLVDEKATKEDVLALVQKVHAELYEQGTALGLVFDESSAVTARCNKDC